MSLHFFGKFPPLGYFSKQFLEMGLFWKYFLHGALLDVKCMGYKANHQWNWRVCCAVKESPLEWQFSHAWGTASQTGEFQQLGLGFNGQLCRLKATSGKFSHAWWYSTWNPPYVCLVQNFYFTTFLSYELVNNPPCIQESRGKDKVYHVI